jgi:MFS family permease
MTMLGLAMAFVVAEVTPLFFVTSFTVIAYDLNAMDKLIWILVGPYISTGAVAPFVGSLSDLMGRKGLIIFSLGLAIVSFIMQGAAPTFACYLTGGVAGGAAIGILILTVVAAASELVPVAQRGATIGYIVIGFLPFAPSSLYGQLIAEHDWRYIYALLGIWSAISVIVLVIWYHPPPRPNALGLSKMELLRRIDYGGSTLSVLGVVFFLIGINWGGADYPWKSPQVICMLVFGILTLVIFGFYERYLAKYPMFPARLVQNKRHFFSVAVLCLTSGINYVPLTVFWTIQVYTVYGASFQQAGMWLLPLGFCIAGGAIISAILITVFKRHIQWVLVVFCILQVLGKCRIFLLIQDYGIRR